MTKKLHQSLSQVLRTSNALALANFKLKHEGSVLGILWYILEPLLVFTVLIMVRNALGIEQEYYPLYLFSGLILFNFFSSTTNQAARSLISNGGIIEWLNIRLETFPLANVIQYLFSHIAELIILIGLFIFLGAPLAGLIWYPIVFMPLILFTAGAAYLLAAVTIYVQDLANVWNVLIGKLLWLGTPIFYSVTPGTLLFTLNQYNPLYHFLELARSVVIYQTAPAPGTIAVTISLSVGTFAIGLFLFNLLKYKAPEKV